MIKWYDTLYHSAFLLHYQREFLDHFEDYDDFFGSSIRYYGNEIYSNPWISIITVVELYMNDDRFNL